MNRYSHFANLVGVALWSGGLTLPLAAGDDPFAGLSEELLLPESPYLFVNAVTLHQGYRRDDLQAGGFPGDSFDFYELGLGANLHWGKVQFLASLDAGWDSSQDASSLDFLAGIGYDFQLTVTGIRFTPLAGYASHQLDRERRYETSWEGPFLGAGFHLPLAAKWDLQASYRYHWADFEAELLSGPLASGTDDASGRGHTGQVALIHTFTDRLDLSLAAEYQAYESRPGSLSRTQAQWDSWSLRLGLSLKF